MLGIAARQRGGVMQDRAWSAHEIHETRSACADQAPDNAERNERQNRIATQHVILHRIAADADGHDL